MSASGQAKRVRRKIDGVVVLNKPFGLTSNGALQRVKRLLGAKKAGHTGSLDPAATGMLPLCFGEATKASAYLLDADKTYRVTARVGTATDTGDAEGSVIAEAAVPAMSVVDWRKALAAFEGETEQVPPMYSALKKDGKRLYELARKGETVEREPRRINIRSIELLEAHGSRLVFRATCSKGTYIRTLVEDIARSAGSVAHTRRLHRETVAGFEPQAMMSLGRIERLVDEGRPLADWVLPADAALGGMPVVLLGAEAAGRFVSGQEVALPARAECSPGDLVRAYGPGRHFLGVGQAASAGSVAPKRIFHLDAGRPGEGENGADPALAGSAQDI